MIVNDEENVAKSKARIQREENEDTNNEMESGDYLSSSTTTTIAASRRMAHHVHMLVRNSMGSALCLDLFVILPRYRVRIRDETTKMDGPHHDEEKKDDTKIMSLSSRSVELAMQYNPDACYPSIRMVDCHRTGMESFDKMDAATILVLEVRTRMCTVLHSPLVFKFLHSLPSWPTNLRLSSASDTSIHLSKPIVRCDDSSAASSPIVVSCIEKVANLHRLLMLCHNLDINLLSNIVVVLPNIVTDGRRKDEIRLREFEDAVDNFYKVVVVNSDRRNGKCHHRPIIVHEDTAFKIISDMMSERSHAMTTSSAIVSCSRLQSIVGIDLHPSALTLEGNTSTSPALHKLKNADAIVFGYESTGIPDVLTKPLNDWVQIPSRSSINVVAAMSIIFDALFA
jgi:tRNA(Leu) C34 or U34 (ribose-2'-O)-methylase TrmL